MLNNIEIHNFKKIKYLKLENLATLNVIVGNNAIGKTTILEAINLLNNADPSDIHNELLTRFKKSNNRGKRTKELLTLIEHLFFYRNTSNKIKISTSSQADVSFSVEYITDKGGLEKKVTENNLKLQQRPSFLRSNDDDDEKLSQNQEGIFIQQTINTHNEAFFINDKTLLRFVEENQHHKEEYKIVFYNSFEPNAFLDDLKKIRENKQEKDLIEALKIIEPNIQDVELSEGLTGSQLIPFIDIEGLEKRIPYNYLGSGAKNFMFIFTVMLQRKNTIFLFDEIEYSVYYKTLPLVLKSMITIAKANNNQIIMVSHSKDLINSIHAISQEKSQILDIQARRIYCSCCFF